nr:glycosyltransferase [Acidobacteriota bacterium]NIM62104.1 glycosyltransferase [Acidobacteriota bacterium]NIO60640.1 glycosyltransferase [Acidobacteriota bacterium]NIQ29510.1 glycosyltransferase [Acidobacteriota bacterium]NIQ84192.1 glycosyltransferase [Acidobacteriota bacterium]
AAGAAGMYCGSCLHDNTLAAALIRGGHDVSLIPTYTPIRTDEDDVSIGRVFYGAINVYLEQKTSLFRHTPWLLDRMLNHPKLLEWVGKKGSATDARSLGALTLSMLQGEDGRQRKELERLVSWLRDDLRPDVVQLTNSMFLGMARRIREELDVPVVCSVQGEDIFFDDLVEPYKTRVLDTLKQRARDVDRFVATSDFYVDVMAKLLAVNRERIDCVPLGLRLEGHGAADPAPPDEPFTIGYLARICPEKGLHLLIQAFRNLVERCPEVPTRLRIAGYLGERDRAYHRGLIEQVREWGLADRVEFVGEVDRAGKIEFLHSLHLLSVPTVYREPKGLFVLEALANGVPVVQPAHGSFPEMIEQLGGGVLFEPGDADALTAALERLLRDPAGRRELGRRGMEAVVRDRGDDAMARGTIEVYERVLERYRARSGAGGAGA